MKSFLVILSEKQQKSLNDTLLNAHIKYLRALREKGHLPMCGPFTDNKNAMMVIKANSLAQAEDLVNGDPFIKSQYYQKFVIHEFTEANEENTWLSDSNQTLNNINDS